jgi:Host cell surface-exposed lipoprotein
MKKTIATTMLAAACIAATMGLASPANAETTAQHNAVKSAESYVKYSGFSRSGLIDQLEFEQYSASDATYAVDHITVDWNAEAVESAQSYLKYSSFSRSGLIDQLEFEGFTSAQAAYAVNTAYGS